MPELERDLLTGERPAGRAFPVERAILFSLVLHVALILLFLYAPFGSARRSLLSPFSPQPAPDNRIPIVFRSAVGPEHENPKKSEPSNRNRIASGGDPSRPKAETPFSPPRPGPEGLAPGLVSRSPAAAAPAPPGPRGADTRQADNGPPPDKSAAASPDSLRAGGSPGASGAAPRQLPNLDTAIREAARPFGRPGEGGAGTPNPDGGFVDSGPISFETSWYDWGPYADEMVRRIKLHWDIPKLAELGWKGRLTVHFDIRADGSVEGARIVSASGVPPFDYAALQAILKSNPFRPLPKDLLKEIPGKEKEGITVTFFYNMRPGKDGTAEGTK